MEIKKKKVYGRKYARKLRNLRADLLENKLQSCQIALPNDGQKIAPSSFIFNASEPNILEIGFGNGDHLAQMATRYPTYNFLGAEPFLTGVSYLLKLMHLGNIGNIKIYPDDASELLDALPSESFDEVYVLFPDPWPKLRHHKRRFVSKENVEKIYKVLKPHGKLVVATDIVPLARFMVENIIKSNHFIWHTDKPSLWRVRPSDWIITKYEEKAMREKRKPVYLFFEKR